MFALHLKLKIMDQNIIIPILGILTGIIVPISVFIWKYYQGKGKRETVLEISKHLDDPAKLEDLFKLPSFFFDNNYEAILKGFALSI